MNATAKYIISKSDFIEILKEILISEYATGILSAEAKRSRISLQPKFIEDEKELEEFPLSEMLVYHYRMQHNAASAVFQGKRSLSTNLCVVARSCEIRAMVEQQKLNQTKIDNLFLIGFIDYGIISDRELTKVLKKKGIDPEDIVFERLTPTELILHLKSGKIERIKHPEEVAVAENCLRCSAKVPPVMDLSLSTLGLPEEEQSFLLQVYSKKGEEILAKLNLSKASASQEEALNEVLQKIQDSAAEKLAEDLAEYRDNKERLEIFNKCTVCGMCVRACPVCVCPICNLTEQKKEEKIDSLTFLMTRVSHVGDTCVNCGKCNMVCPMNIPLSLIFHELVEEVENTWGYATGNPDRKKTLRQEIDSL